MITNLTHNPTGFIFIKIQLNKNVGKCKGNRKVLLLRSTEIPINFRMLKNRNMFFLYTVCWMCLVAFAFRSHCFSLINMAIVTDDNIEWPSWNRPSGTVLTAPQLPNHFHPFTKFEYYALDIYYTHMTKHMCLDTTAIPLC